MLSVLLFFKKLFSIAGVLALSSVSKHIFLFQQKVGQIYVLALSSGWCHFPVFMEQSWYLGFKDFVISLEQTSGLRIHIWFVDQKVTLWSGL